MLVADCPQRNAQQERERCDPYAPELMEFFGKARAPGVAAGPRFLTSLSSTSAVDVQVFHAIR